MSGRHIERCHDGGSDRYYGISSRVEEVQPAALTECELGVLPQHLSRRVMVEVARNIVYTLFLQQFPGFLPDLIESCFGLRKVIPRHGGSSACRCNSVLGGLRDQ